MRKMASDTTAAQHQQLTPATTAAMATPHVASMVPTPPQAQTQTEQQQRPASSQSSPFPVMVVAQHGLPSPTSHRIFRIPTNSMRRLSRYGRRRNIVSERRPYRCYSERRWIRRRLVDGNFPPPLHPPVCCYRFFAL